MSVSAVVRWSLGLFISVCVACGDDGGDGTPSPDAGGTGGTGGTMHDAGPTDAGRTTLPRSDARVAPMDPIRHCNPGDNSSCSNGETCDLLIRFTVGVQDPDIYNGCVPATRERAAGDPCDPNPTNNQPLRLPGLVDEVYRDECGPGLVCAPNRNVRNGFSCQTACSSQVDPPVLCTSPTAICFPATGFSEYCREAEGCDVNKQSGCLAGESCYLIWSDDERRLLTLCSLPLDMPDPVGDATCNPLTCQVGNACLGPVHKAIADWQRADVKCRPLCGAGSRANDVDAGDSDAGVGAGGCSGSAKCAPYEESGLSLSSIPKPPYGQCE